VCERLPDLYLPPMLDAMMRWWACRWRRRSLGSSCSMQCSSGSRLPLEAAAVTHDDRNVLYASAACGPNTNLQLHSAHAMAAASHATSEPPPPSQHSCSSTSRKRDKTRSRGSAASTSANTTNCRRASLTASAAASTGTLLSKLPVALSIEARPLCLVSPALSTQAWYAAATAAQSLQRGKAGRWIRATCAAAVDVTCVGSRCWPVGAGPLHQCPQPRLEQMGCRSGSDCLDNVQRRSMLG
jgi:hypothetical protein